MTTADGQGGGVDGEDAPPPSLSELVRMTVDRLDGLTLSSEAGALIARRGDRVIGLVAGGELVVDLGPAVAAAACRTPDVSASPRGPGWVAFHPPVVDRYAEDRAVAWLEHAWRRAE